MSGESDEKVNATIAALKREREYPTADLPAIDAELRRLGVSSPAPREKAQKRPRAKAARTR